MSEKPHVMFALCLGKRPEGQAERTQGQLKITPASPMALRVLILHSEGGVSGSHLTDGETEARRGEGTWS